MRSLVWLVPLFFTPLFAHDPITTKLTWSAEISRLLQARCMGCHQDGGAAPFALTSYEQARPWAVAIRDEVTQRTMPPWGAVRGFGDFRDDPSLTQEEIEMIIDWVNGGAPEGDPKLAPTLQPKMFAYVQPRGRAVPVSGALRFIAPARIAALKPTAPLEAILRRADGSIEPLVWVNQYKPAWRHAFAPRDSVEVGAGDRIEFLPLTPGARLVVVLQ